MRFLISILTMSFFVFSAFAGNEGKGGGGTIRNGRPQTFYSAGIITGLVPLKENEIPQLNEMAQHLGQHPYLSADLKSRILSSLLPSDNRQYFKVLADHFDQETELRLRTEYGRIAKQDPSTLVLFAVTDTKSKTTYLLPSFYDLSPPEQKAILGHEGYWISDPRATYKEVLNVEYAYQAYFENPADSSNLGNIISLIGNSNDYFKFAIDFDRDNNTLGNLFDKKSTLTTLFGEQFFNCISGSKHRACFSYVYAHLYSFRVQYPDSKLLPYLMKEVAPNSPSYLFLATHNHWAVIEAYPLESSKNSKIKLEYVCSSDNFCGLALEGGYESKSYSSGSNAVSQYLGQFMGGYTNTTTIRFALFTFRN